MKKYYVLADLSRDPNGAEAGAIPASGKMYAGRIKAVVLAKDPEEAMAVGKKIITGSLRKGLQALNWTWNEVDFVERNGDKEIYDKYLTATWVSYYRVQKGLTQAQLSEGAGVNIRQIQKVEAGDIEAGNMTARNLLAIADVLGVDPHVLI